MSIQSEINRINENVAATYSVLEEAGADAPATANTDNLAETAASIKAVLYGKAQTLTDDQKAQARDNINAQEKLSGTSGQVVGFDADGNPVAQEAPSGASSWNDLEDKPVVSGGGDTLIWDGNTDGLVSIIDMLYKVSDSVPALDDFANGCTVTANTTEGVVSMPVTAPEIQTSPYGSLIVAGMIYIVPEEAIGTESLGTELFAEAGVYFASAPDGRITSLTINGYAGFASSEKFDPSYLYQPDWNQTDMAAADFIKNKPSVFSGSYNDLSDVPTSFTPAAHSHQASKITKGTFAGQVIANASTQDPGVSIVRNTKLVSTEETPTVNGEIFWVYG